MATISKLIKDVNNLGLPLILVQRTGFLLKVMPDSFQFQEADVVFTLKGQHVCRVCTLEEYLLVEKIRPANYLVKCEKCYQLVIKETDSLVCYFVWPKRA